MALLNVQNVKSILSVSCEEKTAILECLGYIVNDNNKLVNSETGKLHICPISKKPIDIDNASVVPGSVLVINSDTMSLAEYFAQNFEIL